MSTLVAMAVLLLWLGGYAVLCAVRPFGDCRRCKATGGIVRFGKPRTCPRCRGKRLRLRVGRRVHNTWRRTYDNGAR